MKNRYLSIGSAALLALLLGACSTPAATTSSPAAPSASVEEGHDHAESPANAEETEDRSPRIVVGTETGVSVLDAQLKEVGSFPTTGRPSLTAAHDGRHVVAAQAEAGVVNIIDSGSWTQAHGDHFHFYVADPGMFEEALQGGKPIHVVPNAEAGVTTVYFDEGGYAEALTTEALETQELHGLTKLQSKAPHHGVVVPLADGTWLATQAGDDALPDTIDWLDGDGHTTATVDCADLHGEAVVGDTALFGCSDSVVQVREGKGTVIPAPDASGERVGQLVAGSDGKVFLGDWAPNSLVFISDGAAKVVEVGVEYSNLVALPDGRFAILGTDGVLRVFKATGEADATFEVTKPWTKPKGHGGIAPMLAAGANSGAATVWVTEPEANLVHAVDLFANEVSSATVSGAPGSIAVTNAAK